MCRRTVSVLSAVALAIGCQNTIGRETVGVQTVETAQPSRPRPDAAVDKTPGDAAQIREARTVEAIEKVREGPAFDVRDVPACDGLVRKSWVDYEKDRRPRATVTMDTMKAEGRVDTNRLTLVLEQRARSLRRCYLRRLKRSQAVGDGTVRIRGELLPRGRVVQAEVVEDRLGDAAVGICVVGSMKRWRYPKHDGVAPVPFEVTYRFTSGLTDEAIRAARHEKAREAEAQK